jgi:hypothetical protein
VSLSLNWFNIDRQTKGRTTRSCIHNNIKGRKNIKIYIFLSYNLTEHNISLVLQKEVVEFIVKGFILVEVQSPHNLLKIIRLYLLPKFHKLPFVLALNGIWKVKYLFDTWMWTWKRHYDIGCDGDTCSRSIFQLHNARWLIWG